MYSATAIVLLNVVKVAHANDLAANRSSDAQDMFINRRVERLVDRAVKSWPVYHTGVDNMVIGKPSHIALSTPCLMNAPLSNVWSTPQEGHPFHFHHSSFAVRPATLTVRYHPLSISHGLQRSQLVPMAAAGDGKTIDASKVVKEKEDDRVLRLEAELKAMREKFEHLAKQTADSKKVPSEPETQEAKAQAQRANVRANKESATGARIKSGLLGGPFQRSNGSAYIDQRIAVFDRIFKDREAKVATLPDEPIEVTLPDGSMKSAVAFKTTPMDIALNISKGLAKAVIIARVKYSKRLDDGAAIADSGGWDKEDDLSQQQGELWDLGRPLVGDCTLSLLKWDPDDEDVRTVFWHSSAHVLGAALENSYGAQLTIGPPLKSGFYYDSYIGDNSFSDEDLKGLDKQATKVIQGKHDFIRLEVSKEEALEMFATNPFKVSLITNKVPDGSRTSVYRCGPMIDLCMGPHIPNTGRIKAFATTSTSATNWLGQVDNDPLQRVYGISFPDNKEMKKWKEIQEEAKKRDHQVIGTKQELFFFNKLSPGSAFWLPHGARIHNKLVDFIKKQYWSRGYQEVMTPNMFNLKLWEQSGHAQLYKENMFTFEVEKEEFGLKPMNCPGHCCMFAHRIRSYRELPMRVADFGVLHRNEVSGSLTGLTRVRRFQQDDAHIFCTFAQIKEEVIGALDFMRFVYSIFGMTYKLELSTRPKKALGDVALWDKAEAQLTEALDEFAGKGNWKVNPGDGAFYGPKIDIKVSDALQRVHQCATVQLDFQLPIRFDLKYQCQKDRNATEEASEYERPVMIHRAMLGSVERIFAVLTEHWGGKWPLWISPRQMCLVPVDPAFTAYAEKVQQRLRDEGFYADVDSTSRTLNKKVREAQQSQYNFILVVGQKEVDAGAVNIRTRDNKQEGTMSVDEAVAKFAALVAEYK